MSKEEINYISRDSSQLERNGIWRLIRLDEKHHDHKIITWKDGVLAWEQTLFDRNVKEDISHLCKLGYSKNSEEFRLYLRSLGYSLFGYWEFLFCDFNNPDYLDYVGKPLSPYFDILSILPDSKKESGSFKDCSLVKEVSEFTDSKELLSGTFPQLNVDYQELFYGILDGLTLHVNILEGYILDKYFDEDNKDDLTLSVPNNLLKDYPKYKSMVIKKDEYHSLLKFNTKQEYIECYTIPGVNFHTKVAKVDEEILLTKIKDKKDEYLMLWYSTTRNNSLLRFKSDFSEEQVKQLFIESYLDKLDNAYTVIPEHTYRGFVNKA